MIGWWLTSAFAGSLDAEVGLDSLYAGPEADVSGGEVGLRVRGELLEADDRLVVGVDYRGREPLFGSALTPQPLRLLYRLDAAWDTDDVELGLGRFVAPAVVGLRMAGARARLNLGDAWVLVYGGRRGITASRRALPLDAFLPAAGAQVGRTSQAWRGELLGTFSGDRVFLGVPGAEQQEDVLGGSGLARASITAIEGVSFGGQVSAARNATYAVAPVAGTYEISVDALSLYDVFGWVALRPSPGLRVDVDALHQRAELARTAAPVEVPLVDPSFSDLRVRGAVGDPRRFWIRPDARLRLRDGRTELRYGGGADAHDLGLVGPFVRGRLWLEDVIGDVPDDVGAIDRLLWTASGGWERGAVQLEGGASFVDRAAGPVSGRTVDPNDPGTPLSSEDLSPFALEAQNVAFVRGFAVSRRFFLGVDVEANVQGGELRSMFQVGVLPEATW